MKNIVIVFLMLLAACTTSSNHKRFDLPAAEENKGVLIGKVDVKYDLGNFDSEMCRFCIDRVCPQLLEEGYVFMALKQVDVARARLSCFYPDIGYINHLFEVSQLEVKPGIVYFGNLTVTVKFESSHTFDNPNYVPPKPEPPEDYSHSQTSYGTSNIAKQLAIDMMRDTVDGIVDVFVSDYTPETITAYDMPATVSVEDGMSGVVEVFRKQVGKDDVQVEKNLIDIKWIRQKLTKR